MVQGVPPGVRVLDPQHATAPMKGSA